VTPKKKIGRPPSTDPHLHRVPARFTATERLELERRAVLAGVSLAEYIRRLALSPTIARDA
jgi:hypothetical protein